MGLKKQGESDIKSLIADIASKNLTQLEIAQLIKTTPATLSKLKGVEYFPKNDQTLIEKLEKLQFAPDHNPKKVFEDSANADHSNFSSRQIPYFALCFILGIIASGLLIIFFTPQKN